MHLSLVIDWSMIDGGVSFMMRCNGFSKDASGNSAILSIRGEFTETSGDFNLVIMLVACLFSGVLIVNMGSDSRRIT